MTNLPEISLYEILEAIANEYASQNRAVGFSEDDKFLTVNQAQAAIAELVEGCLPEKDMVNSDDPVANAHAESHNNAIDQIRNNLIKVGVLNG